MSESGPIHREDLLTYFVQAARPRDLWLVGMELEQLARDRGTGRPLPFEGRSPSIREVLEHYRDDRGDCEPIWEGDHLVGLDGRWGSVTLEPGGQVEWSSRPATSLDDLLDALEAHQAAIARVSGALGVDFLDVAMDPRHAVDEMEWMPKARYRIMRPYLGARGRLAHRMMTQTASIQCAFDYADPGDWLRKFRAAAYLAPLATALFANSEVVDGAASGYRSYRQRIWRETDPERCGLPGVVFEADFTLERWVDWVLRVPTIFRHRARGLVPAGGIPFEDLLSLAGCDALRPEDWETHVSTIFTEVRSYTYIEVRSADLQPAEDAIAVPAFWTGLLYDETALDGALELGRPFATHEDWLLGMELAARDGLQVRVDGRPLMELARRAMELALAGLAREPRGRSSPRSQAALGRLAKNCGVLP